jgi:cell division protein FtsW (lipid II flippase)
MASKIKNRFGYNIWTSITMFLSMQFVILILSNLGVGPIIYSYGLPFVSISGTASAGNMILVGLLLSIWRSNNVEVQDGLTCEEELNIN